MTKKQKAKESGTKKRWRFFPVFEEAEAEQQERQQELDALERDDALPPRQSLLDRYKDYPLAQSMLAGESTRNQTLIRDGRKQGDYVKSNDGWIKTLFVIEVRCNWTASWRLELSLVRCSWSLTRFRTHASS